MNGNFTGTRVCMCLSYRSNLLQVYRKYSRNMKYLHDTGMTLHFFIIEDVWKWLWKSTRSDEYVEDGKNCSWLKSLIPICCYYLPDRRLELLKSSRLSVVAFLNDLPSTKHDLESLTVDVNFVQVSVLNDQFSKLKTCILL